MTPETSLKSVVKAYLKLKGYFYWHNLAGLGVFRGIPDDFVLHDGILYGLEYKAPKGKMSGWQEIFRQEMDNHGGKYIEVRSLEDVTKYL